MFLAAVGEHHACPVQALLIVTAVPALNYLSILLNSGGVFDVHWFQELGISHQLSAVLVDHHEAPAGLPDFWTPQPSGTTTQCHWYQHLASTPGSRLQTLSAFLCHCGPILHSQVSHHVFSSVSLIPESLLISALPHEA